MDLQHIAIKLFATKTAGFEQTALIPLFHRWIQNKIFHELLPIDVADYTHIHEGPGVMLICHKGHLSLDEGNGRLGVLYSNKSLATGGVQDRFRDSLRHTLTAAGQLETDTTLQFACDELLIRINDRLHVPNTAESFHALRDDLQQVLTALYGGVAVDLEHIENRKIGLAIRAASREQTNLATLLKRVTGDTAAASGK